jgi:hypothetical protein
MDKNSIYKYFGEVYGFYAEESVILSLCETVCEELALSAREKADLNDIRLIALGAAMVNHRLCMRNFYSGEGVTSFKAGDVTVNSDTVSLLAKAKEQLDLATENASSLIKDTTFSFKQVRI